ncbi:MAG: hypothetical protein MZV70_46420 [Desulfobacterales bacterium]|nr:hypothetical protein [Desulfobacterales bacterium]
MYALEGSIAIAGRFTQFQWLRDNLGLIEKSSDVETLAKSVSDSVRDSISFLHFPDFSLPTGAVMRVEQLSV